MARIAIQDAGGALVRYQCPPTRQRCSPPTVCVCATGATFDAAEVAGCPESWGKQHLDGYRSGPLVPRTCRADSGDASFPVYPDAGGALSFTALGNAGVTVGVR